MGSFGKLCLYSYQSQFLLKVSQFSQNLQHGVGLETETARHYYRIRLQHSMGSGREATWEHIYVSRVGGRTYMHNALQEGL